MTRTAVFRFPASQRSRFAAFLVAIASVILAFRYHDPLTGKWVCARYVAKGSESVMKRASLQRLCQ